MQSNCDALRSVAAPNVMFTGGAAPKNTSGPYFSAAFQRETASPSLTASFVKIKLFLHTWSPFIRFSSLHSS